MEQSDISLLTLVKYRRRELSADEALRIERAIEQDSGLREMMTLISRLDESSDDLDWANLAPGASRLSDRLFEDFQRGPGHGVVVFDSSLLPLPIGIRPAAVDTRRLRYRIHDLMLDLSLYPVTPESYELIGQISAIPPSDAMTVTLHGPRTEVIETDAYGLFRFDRVACGHWEIAVRSKETVIGVISLEI